MSDRMMRSGLRHKWAWSSNDAAFFAEIDAGGGWPVGYQYVGFEHTDERDAGFCNSPHNSGWWTIVASADDYYLWKLSPAALQRVADAVVSAIRLPHPDASKLWIKGDRIARAALSTQGGK